MKKFVRVNMVNGDFHDKQIGVIYINRQGRIACQPPDNDVLNEICEETVRRWPHEAEPEDVDASEPEVFLESLHHVYQSAYTRIGPVETGMP